MGISGGCCGCCELIGEHSFSVRDQGPAEGARTILGKAPPQPKMALATIQVFGDYRSCLDLDIPRLCRDTGPPSMAGSLFLGVRSPNRRESPNVRFRLVRDSRQMRRRTAFNAVSPARTTQPLVRTNIPLRTRDESHDLTG